MSLSHISMRVELGHLTRLCHRLCLNIPVNHYKVTAIQPGKSLTRVAQACVKWPWKLTEAVPPPEGQGRLPPLRAVLLLGDKLPTCSRGSQGRVLCRVALLSLLLPPYSFCSPFAHIPSCSLFSPHSRPLCIPTASQSLLWRFTGDPFHIPCDSLEEPSSGSKTHLSTEKSDAHPKEAPGGSLET